MKQKNVCSDKDDGGERILSIHLTKPKQEMAETLQEMRELVL